MGAKVIKAVQTTHASDQNPASLLAMALQKGVDMAQLSALMDLQDRYDKKESRKSFFDALSKFQTLCPVLKKSKTAKIASAKGSFSYKYADLGSITRAIAPHLNTCGLSYRWDFEEKNDKLRVTCHVSHRDGHSETTSMEAGRDTSGFKNDIQQKGSTQTYLQRYTLIGSLGLSTADTDNDAATVDKGLTEEEILSQWKQIVSECKTTIELNQTFYRNRKEVEANDNVKDIFSARKAELATVQNKPVILP